MSCFKCAGFNRVTGSRPTHHDLLLCLETRTWHVIHFPHLFLSSAAVLVDCSETGWLSAGDFAAEVGCRLLGNGSAAEFCSGPAKPADGVQEVRWIFSCGPDELQFRLSTFYDEQKAHSVPQRRFITSSSINKPSCGWK